MSARKCLPSQPTPAQVSASALCSVIAVQEWEALAPPPPLLPRTGPVPQVPSPASDLAAAPARPIVPPRFVTLIITIFASLVALRVTFVAWEVAADRDPARRTAREQEITRWMKEDLGNAQALMLSTGEVHRSFWTSNSWLDLLIHEPQAAPPERDSLMRLTFDRHGHIISSHKRPAG